MSSLLGFALGFLVRIPRDRESDRERERERERGSLRNPPEKIMLRMKCHMPKVAYPLRAQMSCGQYSWSATRTWILDKGFKTGP